MVEEEWNIGDEFIVIEDKKGEHLKKGDKGKIVYIPPISSGYVYFRKGYSIRKKRIQKINSQKIYELW
jgi:hypothetical protein